MTYNFDPDRWFDMESEALGLRLARKEIDRETHDRELEALVARYEELVERVHMPHSYSDADQQ